MVIIVVSMVVIILFLFFGMVMFLKKFMDKEVTMHTSHLQTLESENAAKADEIKKQYEEAKRQSQEIISNAQKDAQTQKDAMLKAAQEEKDKILAETLAKADEMIKQADNARLALLSELEVKIKEGAVVKAQELLISVLPEDFRRQIHGRWVKDAIAGGFAELDRLRLPQGLSEVSVVSAFPLSESEAELLKTKLKEKLGSGFELKQQTDESLISGLVVNVGSLILDASLKFKIQEAARG